MGKIFRFVIVVFMSVFLIAASFASLANPDFGNSTSTKDIQKKLNKVSGEGVVVTNVGGVAKVITDINHMPLTDNVDLYQYDDPDSVVTMYLTVRGGNQLENTNHSWKEVNDVTKFLYSAALAADLPKTEAILQIGDETGPRPGELGYDMQVPNATVQIRGNSTSQSPQKSYKISLFDGSGEWRGQKTINLNKHVYDSTRARNKLAFDLMQGMPNMVSLRTQFVHLYVKDETANPPRQAFEDYGLFTQVEQPNQKFLKNHLLDRFGQLYKATMFEFYRYPEIIRMADDPQYDEAAFSKILEIKGNKDHTKLIEMLDEVNDAAIPIEQTFAKYFDEDNYFTWMAFNILIGNVDTNSQNFYLYSPQNGRKWYFLPWDYDGAFERLQFNNSRGKQGISTYWGVVLHRRVLSVPAYREKLDQKMHELMDIVTPERVNNMLNVYRPVTDQFVARMPDLLHLPVTLEEYDQAYSRIPNEMQKNYQGYVESLAAPMPYYLGTPEAYYGDHRFVWEEAYDFQAQDITYYFEIAKTWDFENVVASEKLTNVTHIEIPQLAPGTYFWRVTATNEDGQWQEPFDYYIDSEGYWHHGMKYLLVSPDGEILEKQSE